jgi:hypothetical protein
MPDDGLRQRVTKLVYENLADRSFRDLLTATAPDGSRPVIVALPADPLRDLLHKLEAVGRAGNVVLPKANGFVVIAISNDDPDDSDEPATLTPDCTVGVFFARVWSDGGEGSYRFIVKGPGTHREGGRAELVALGR